MAHKGLINELFLITLRCLEHNLNPWNPTVARHGGEARAVDSFAVLLLIRHLASGLALSLWGAQAAMRAQSKVFPQGTRLQRDIGSR